MTYYQKLIQHIENIKEILTEENWGKDDYYFSNKNNILCINVDGAIQTQVNPEVKKVYEQYLNKKMTGARAAARCAGTTGSAARVGPAASARAALAATTTAHVRRVTKDFSDLFDLWVNREDWIKEDYIYHNKNYGNLDLHYLVGLTCLDYNFEKEPLTTLSMIKNKLDETIKLIKKIEKYIAYV